MSSRRCGVADLADARVVTAALGFATVVSMPVMLVGFLSVQLRSDFQLGPGKFGLIIATYYAGAAVVSVPAGYLTEEWRPGGVLRLAVLVSAASLVLVAVGTHTWLELAGCMAGAGAASGTAQPAVNAWLSERIAFRRQGLAFGVKQAAVPLAGLLAGAAVPSIALTVGWRWAFLGSAALGLLAAGRGRQRSRLHSAGSAVSHRGKEGSYEPILPLVVLALGFGIGLAAADSLSAYVVSSGTRDGLMEALVGMIAAGASALCVGARVLIGLIADKIHLIELPTVAVLICAGAGGFFLLAAAAAWHSGGLYLVGAVGAFTLGYGWNGLFNLAIVRDHPFGPARATGITQTGGWLGGVIGPAAFGGIVAVQGSYVPAWLLVGCEALVSSLLIMRGHKLLYRTSSGVGKGNTVRVGH